MTRLFDAKPFIIAEVGSNWRDLRDAVESIGRAKACGADAVKFQAFTPEALFGPLVPGLHLPDPHSLPIEWLPKLKEKADACGIEFMCTAFSPELVAAVDPYVSVHKIASSDLSYPQLLQAVAKTGKPVLLSTGASSKTDIDEAVTWLDGAKTVLMYCVSAYPARQTCLATIDLLKKTYGAGSVGFSDHSTDVVGIPYEASTQYGIVALEKHFTAFPDVDTPDRPHSLTPDEFKLMTEHIRGTRRPVIAPEPEEKAMVLRHNRRLVATQDIGVGTVLKYGENYGAYRSLEDDTRGLSPFFWNHPKGPEGKRASVTIARGKGIGPGDFA
jgi:N,N'-diacetyllegionaminate synthase